MNAPYSGGYAPGNRIFAVDGDFTSAFPVSPPNVSYPFKGDSFPDITSIILMNSSQEYVDIPIGSGYNIQPFAANQAAIVFTQSFMVAIAYYVPLPLNTPYNLAWSIGWEGTYAALGNCFLVEEGPLEHVGAGIARFERKYANLPPTRNVPESYSYTFPSFTDGIDTRQAFTTIAPSRIQLDYFVYDDLELLGGLVPGLFPTAHRLDATTGMFPTGLILPEQRYYQNATDAVDNRMLLDSSTPLTDDDDGTPPAPTNPSYTEYIYWVDSLFEIVAEASSLEQWMGNIYVRKTRFVVAQ